MLKDVRHLLNIVFEEKLIVKYSNRKIVEIWDVGHHLKDSGMPDVF